MSASCENATRIPSPARISNCCTWVRFNYGCGRHRRSGCHRGWHDSRRIAAGRGHCNASGPAAASGMLLGGTPTRCIRRTGLGRVCRPGAAAAADAADNSGCAGRRPCGTPNHSRTKSGTIQDRPIRAEVRRGDSDKLSSAVFGGGPIVGVASISKAQTIREFNHKNHYNQWQFIYDPDHGSRRADYDAGAAAVEFAAPIQQQNSSSYSGKIRSSRSSREGTRFFHWPSELRRRPSPRHSSNNNRRFSSTSCESADSRVRLSSRGS